MIFVALGVAVLALLVWIGRRPGQLPRRVRIARVLASALAAAGAVGIGLRGQWLVSLALIACSAVLAMTAKPAAPAGADRGRGSLSVGEARSILGVAPGASRAEIEAAYRNLMRRAHPDQGGSTGLAAQVNAARDRLLG